MTKVLADIQVCSIFLLLVHFVAILGAGSFGYSS